MLRHHPLPSSSTLRGLCESLGGSVLRFDEKMLSYHTNELRFDNRGRKVAPATAASGSSGSSGPTCSGSTDGSAVKEGDASTAATAEISHDALRVRQIHSELNYELHPWKTSLEEGSPARSLLESLVADDE